jgi:hypothetical protein
VRPYGEGLPDETGELRLRLHHVEMQRDAFEAALRKEVLAVVKEALADNEVARLKAEVERLTELLESNLNSSKVAMGKADAVLHERDSLKAEVERLKHENNLLRMRAVDDPAIRRALLEVVYERMRAECK